METLVGEDAVALLRAGVDGLLADDLTARSAAEVIDLVRDVEMLRRRLEAVDHVLLAEVAERGVLGEIGSCTATDLLTGELRVSPGEARRRVSEARELGPRRTLTGQPLEPAHAVVATAQAHGEISAEHAGIVLAAVRAVPPTAGVEAAAIVEAYLTEAARHQAPRALRESAAQLLARIDPDGVEPAEERAERRRSFGIRPGGDGSFTPTGALTGETAALWQTIINALSAPAPAEDGTPDERTAGQRRHDALLEAGLRLLRSGTLPDCGGVPVTILARTTVADLARMAAERADQHDSHNTSAGAGVGDAGNTGSPVAVTEHGDLMSLRALLRLGCEADIVTVVLDDLGGILDYGLTRRLASPGQRRALAVRDSGCSFPGCDRPPSWTEAHHIIEWLDLGPTDIDNLCLLCAHHHRSFESQGWSVRMIDERPEWIPPPWIDHEREPRRNTAQHLDCLDFADHIDGADLAETAWPGG